MVQGEKARREPVRFMNGKNSIVTQRETCELLLATAGRTVNGTVQWRGWERKKGRMQGRIRKEEREGRKKEGMAE